MMGSEQTMRRFFCATILCLITTFAYAGDAEDVFWESVVKANVQEEYELYLKQYPKGRYAGAARLIVEGMREKARAQQEAKKQKQAQAEAAKRAEEEAKRREEEEALRRQAEAEAERERAEQEAMRPGRVFRDCDECPEMVVIPAGSFTMGSPASSDEVPQHLVTIARQFAAGKFEVTFDECDVCVRESGCGHNPGDEGWGRGRRPVINVSWNDAKQYVRWLSRKTGWNYRLLSEAEWEYVTRAGTTTAFSWGNSITPQQANYRTTESYAGSPVTASYREQTVPVGSFEPNAFGLYDVHGNVWEWTEDCLNFKYYGAPADGSAWISGDCGYRVLRGGSWVNVPIAARSAFRLRNNSGNRYNYFGFRVARMLP